MISPPGIYWKLGHFPVKIGLIRGVGGVPEFTFLIGISLFCYFGAHAKIQNSMTSLSRIYLKLADFPVKIGLNGGQWGSPNFFLMGILLFMLLGSPCINLEPYDKHFWNIFENSPFSGQNRVNWGGRGGPRNLFFIGILLILLLRSPCKNSEP